MHLPTLTTLVWATTSSAHFLLNWPPSAGFDDDLEGTSPCGSFAPAVNSSSPNITVERFAVQIFSSHPAGEWAFLGTTDTQAPYNFTEIVPVINTTGIGGFCLTELSVPSAWAGKAGVLQVVDNSVDGVLYQCAPVNFVTGTNSTVGPTCANNTGFSASWTNLDSLNGSATSSVSPTGTSSVTTSTSSGDAVAATALGSFLGVVGLAAAGVLL